MLSHIFTNSHIGSLSFPHSLAQTPLHTDTRPHGEWCLHKPPPLASYLSSFTLILSLSHSLSLDSFSDMPAQAHLAAHAPPPPPATPLALPLPHSLPPSLPPFTFLPCDISMATWKETSVLGEQCDGAGCKGWGGGCSKEAQDKEGIEGSGGCTVCPPRETRAPLAWQQPPPPAVRSGFKCEGDGNRVGCCHTMSNQYELPRAVGPQRHISSKVALYTEMVAALKFTSIRRLNTHTYGSVLRNTG